MLKRYNNMGNALKDQGKLDEATASANEALRLEPTSAKYALASFNLLLAYSYRRCGTIPNPLQNFDKALGEFVGWAKDAILAS